MGPCHLVFDIYFNTSTSFFSLLELQLPGECELWFKSLSFLSTSLWMACEFKFFMEGESLSSEDESDVTSVGLNLLVLLHF